MSPIIIAAISALFTDILVLTFLMKVLPALAGNILRGTERRVHSLDGLRGIVALSVVMHHSIMNWRLVTTGARGAPVENLANQMGSASVAIFFMISAFLFCGRLVKNNGRLNIIPFAEGRIARIVPLYVFVVLCLLFYSFTQTGFEARPSWLALARQMSRWLSFDFVRRYPLNDVPKTFDILGMIWSLKYEWMLYALLPVLAIVTRKAGKPWPIFVGLIGASFVYPLFSFFVAGAAAAILIKFDGPIMRQMWQAAGIAGLLFDLLMQHGSGGWLQTILLTPFFVAVLQGHRTFALLGRGPLRYLGEISYSVYLIHGFVIASIAAILPWEHYGMIGAWLEMVVIGLVAIGAASLSFIFIERTTMNIRFTSKIRDGASPVLT